MKEAWTGDIVGRMHSEEITYEELGKELGVGKSYISMILNGSRKPVGIRAKIEAAINSISARMHDNN